MDRSRPTILKAPRAGERIQLLPPTFGRTMCRQSFFYEGGREEEYVLWSYEKATGALILPLTTKREIVAVRQFRHGVNGFTIKFPGGVPATETDTAEDTGAKELLEETGYQAKVVQDLGFQGCLDPSSLNARMSFLVGLECEKVADPTPDPNEILETLVVPIGEWYEMILRREIIDSKTIALSLVALPLLGVRLQF